MITKSRLIGLLAILVVGLLILRSGDESCDSGKRSANAGSTNGQRPPPRTSDFPTPSQDHGMVGRTGAQNAPPPHSRRGFYPEQPYPGLDYGGYGSSDPYGDPYDARTRIHTDGYRFRPLAEQAQQDRQTPDPDRRQDRYAMPHNPPSRYQSPPPEQRQPNPPALYPPYSSQPAYADHPWEIYNFRPLEKSPGARGRWQGPYGQPDRHLDPYPPASWSPSPPPQWGSTSPSQRM